MSDPVNTPPQEATALARTVKRGIVRAFDSQGRWPVARRLRPSLPRSLPRSLRRPACLTALLALAACGGGKPTDLVLNGVPANTNLHQASSLPADSVRTVARRDYGWRLIYHPARAPVNAEQGAARALCGLEGRRPARIDHIPRIDPYADPGARIIDIHCA